MLVLSRRNEETIVITDEQGTKIVIQVLNIRYRDVKIGIDAPRHITIMRGELLDKPQANKEQKSE